jgi:hypothetical protein
MNFYNYSAAMADVGDSFTQQVLNEAVARMLETETESAKARLRRLYNLTRVAQEQGWRVRGECTDCPVAPFSRNHRFTFVKGSQTVRGIWGDIQSALADALERVSPHLETNPKPSERPN